VGELQCAGCAVGEAVAGSLLPTTVRFSDAPKAARASFARCSIRQAEWLMGKFLSQTVDSICAELFGREG
jgi:hypothetical protein